MTVIPKGESFDKTHSVPLLLVPFCVPHFPISSEDPEKVTEPKRMKRGERKEDSPPLASGALCPSLAALESLSWEHPPPVPGDQALGRAAGRAPEVGLGKACLLF